MSFCGLRNREKKALRRLQKGKSVERGNSSYNPAFVDVRDEYDDYEDNERNRLLHRRKSADFEWAREDQLSVILEILEESSRKGNTPNWEKDESSLGWDRATPPAPAPRIPPLKRTRFVDRDSRIRPIPEHYAVNMSDKRTPESPRPIQTPPRDLESISRIDASLVFEHFTTNDAWELGSALRNRLLPFPIPVVINISLANQNQTLFHTCTHPGVMPDNDSWVSRKRKTVLRWGCSTWYMHCKFGGDEVAFREKYGLGNSAGDYAIHGGGVPIRVTGVEGVVAVVVVSGLKQDEDHSVIVEVIRELYY